MTRRATPPRSPKKRVLKKYPHARCFERGWDEQRQCTWWQVWDEPKAQHGGLLGMGKGPLAAWKDAARRLSA